MGDERVWTGLPPEILCQIFSLLSYNDKVAFSSTCTRWQEAADTPFFWRRLLVKVDLDLNEPGIIFLTQKYYGHLEKLEIGWSLPYPMSDKKTGPRHKDTVKRVGRFLVLLFERNVQLKHLVIFDWYDIHQLKKLCYLLMRFVKCQNHLETVTLVNANLNNINFANILIACMRSKSTITSLNLHYSTYNSWRLFDSWVFTNCLEMFQNLEVLTVDCWIFLQCYNRFQMRLCKLKSLHLYLDDSLKNVDGLVVVRESRWEMFFSFFPRAVVHLKVEKPMRDDQFRRILQKHYSLVSFEWTYRPFKETCHVDCCQCLDRLVKLQQDSLELLKVNFPINQEELTDKIVYIKRKCNKLRSFTFNEVELVGLNTLSL